jgi:hypothetical protein
LTPTATCSYGWEALRGDPFPWLLQGDRPNLQWRAAVELVGRPADSPVVRRAQSAASAAEPVASLIEQLHPNGSWATSAPLWARYAGPGWRLVAAVQWGADPTDPRLHAAAERLLEASHCHGGIGVTSDTRPSLPVTARALQALAGLGWCRHPRFLEALAWLEQEISMWEVEPTSACAVTSVGVMATLAACPMLRRATLLDRVTASLERELGRDGDRVHRRLGFPNLLRTDLAEMLWVLARAGAPYDARMADALRWLQGIQRDGGRWPRQHPVPRTLPIGDAERPSPGQASRWLTLRAVVAITTYAVATGLPRLFPAKPV